MIAETKIQTGAEAAQFLAKHGVAGFLSATGMNCGSAEVCPACSGEHFTIKRKGEGIEFNCRSCGKGDAISLYQKFRECSRDEAEAKLVDLANSEIEERLQESLRDEAERAINDAAEGEQPDRPPMPVLHDASKPSIIRQLLSLPKPVQTYIQPAQQAEQPQPSAGRFDPMQDPRPKVALPGDGWLISQFANELGKILKDHEIYIHGKIVVLPEPLGPGASVLAEMKPVFFQTWVEQYALCYEIDEDSPNVINLMTMDGTTAKAVLASAQFRRWIRVVRRVNKVRLPVIRPDGKIELLTEGYDTSSQILTALEGVTYDENMPFEMAKDFLRELIGEFPFTDSRSLSVLIASMLSLYGVGLLPEGCLKPCFVVVANSEGSGKSLLIKLAVLPIIGTCPTGTKSRNEDEIRKLLLAALRAGRPVVILDNVRDELESAALEAFLTSSVWSDRILGTSTVFAAKNDTFVFVTGNNCSVSPDMRRRSLFAELFSRSDLAEERKFRQRLEESNLHALRPHILSALWSLVRHWDEAGRPGASKEHASFPEWASVIGAITEHSGFGSPVETPKLRTDTSSEVGELRRLVEAMAGSRGYGEMSFFEITRLAQGLGLFEKMVGPAGETLDKKSKTMFSRFLKRYDDRHIAGFEFRLKGVGHSRRYTARKLETTAS